MAIEWLVNTGQRDKARLEVDLLLSLDFCLMLQCFFCPLSCSTLIAFSEVCIVVLTVCRPLSCFITQTSPFDAIGSSAAQAPQPQPQPFQEVGQKAHGQTGHSDQSFVGQDPFQGQAQDPFQCQVGCSA